MFALLNENEPFLPLVNYSEVKISVYFLTFKLFAGFGIFNLEIMSKLKDLSRDEEQTISDNGRFEDLKAQWRTESLRSIE